MTQRLFALERWATRRPATRWPLVLLALLLLVGLAGGLTGCGGGSADDTAAATPAPVPGLVADTSTAQAGDARIGAAVLVLPLPGPVLQLPQPARVHVALAGSAELSAHYGANATAALALAQPLATGPTTVPATLQPQAPTPVPLAYGVWLQLPAGTHALQAVLTLHALDANATPTAALATASATIDWRVQVQP